VSLQFVTGDMFADLEDGTAIAHGCNCQGVMGAGVADIVASKWPHMVDEYRKLCRAKLLHPGDVFPYVTPEGVIVFNLMSQNFPGRDARLEWILWSVDEALHIAERADIKTLRICRIGSGIGGLRATDVEEQLQWVTRDHFITDLVVYSLPEKVAS